MIRVSWPYCIYDVAQRNVCEERIQIRNKRRRSVRERKKQAALVGSSRCSALGLTPS